MSPTLTSAPPTNSGFRALLPWYLALILASYAVTLLTDGAYWYLHNRIHATPAQSLWTSAFWGLCYIPISLLAGKWTDHFGPRPMARTMATLSILAALGVWAVLLDPSVLLLAGLLIPYNFATSSVWPAMESAVTKVPGSLSLNNRLVLYNLAWASTNCLALITVGTWASISWSMLFVVPAIVSGMALLMLSFTSRVKHFPVVSNSPTEHAINLQHSRGHDPKKLLYMAWIGNAMCYVAINVLLPMLPQLTITAGFTDLKISTAAGAIWTLTRLAGFVITWLWTTWHYKPSLLILVQILLAISFATTLLAPIAPLPDTAKQSLFLLAQALFGFCTAFLYASSLYYAMHVSAGAGGHAGIHEALIGVGVAIGPTVGAFFSSGPGTSALPGIATSVTTILILGAGAMLLLTRKSKPNPERLQNPER